MAEQEGQAEDFWSAPADELLKALGSKPGGLSGAEAAARLKLYGPNMIKARKRAGTLSIFIAQFKSPIIIILIFAAILSAFLHDLPDAIIILVIVFASGVLGFWQERGAANAVQKLLEIVRITATILRDGKRIEIPIEDVVPGDVVVLDAGDVIPGDCRIVESNDLFVDEAALTGETYPVEKEAGEVQADAALAQRTNSLFMGTHVISGTANALVVRTGKETEFGEVSERLKGRAEETEFEHGVMRFGYLLMEVTLVLVVAIFAINVYFHKPVLSSFLFSLALAVGLTPQLLPAIISINLSKGAQQMARSKVIVKRLASIENFGSMNVLCSDKTGTLTEGKVRVKSAIDIEGTDSEKAWLYAYINASFETGFRNPIDEAVRTERKFDISGYRKVDEIPYDFIRKRLSIVVARDGDHLMITKGALKNVVDVSTLAEKPDGSTVDISEVSAQIQASFEQLSSEGFRTLGVAYRELGEEKTISSRHEEGMIFLGMLVLFDPAKEGVSDTIKRLRDLGVSLKVITGDNHLVAAYVGDQVGLGGGQVLTGTDLHKMSDEALSHQVNQVNIFAEVEPNQKERIIHALSNAGNVVGYMGDGINDASALHVSDVGISVDTAVDVAKEAADFVLLEKDLGVLVDGVTEGRTTFANTLKYVFMATSANFGNMFSMAGASLFLTFLPLLPGQVLLTNLMTDFPEMTIATDRVDPEMVSEPHRWNIHFIRTFMLVFGLLSSVFDYATFGVLLWVLHASPTQFRTGWFVESVISASMIVLVIRTRRLAIKSRPSKYLLGVTVLVWIAVLVIASTPIGHIFGFTNLPVTFYPYLLGILVLYFGCAEITKKLFYRWVQP
ncbi:MAG TPA: magnesium-translocating P-type ATPase [Candidatus Anoxymicrobiaceae bacterium]